MAPIPAEWGHLTEREPIRALAIAPNVQKWSALAGRRRFCLRGFCLV